MWNCDRCGNEMNYAGSSKIEITTIYEAGYSEDEMHICGACVEILKGNGMNEEEFKMFKCCPYCTSENIKETTEKQYFDTATGYVEYQQGKCNVCDGTWSE